MTYSVPRISALALGAAAMMSLSTFSRARGFVCAGGELCAGLDRRGALDRPDASSEACIHLKRGSAFAQ